MYNFLMRYQAIHAYHFDYAVIQLRLEQLLSLFFGRSNEQTIEGGLSLELLDHRLGVTSSIGDATHGFSILDQDLCTQRVTSSSVIGK